MSRSGWVGERAPNARRAGPSPDATIAMLVDAVGRFLDCGAVDDPRGDARDIVAAIIDAPRLALIRRGEEEASRALAEAAWAAASRRRRGMPLAYAIGRAAFRHLGLEVDERVLIPRPETELLVDLVLAGTGAKAGGGAGGGEGVAIDVGTGSGAIALALATEGRFAHVIGTDISSDALAVARANAGRMAAALVARVDFRPGSYLAPVCERGVQAVVSNPPYISFDEVEALPASVREWEPPVALLAGEGGMAPAAAIIREAADVLAPGGLLAIEVDVRRASLVAELVSADRRYGDVSVRLDLTGRERFIVARRSTRS